MAQPKDPNTVYTVKVSEVDIDFNWNARREVEVERDDTGEGGFNSRVISIAKEGQKTPVVLRPHPHFGKKVRGREIRTPYFLCSGFTRAKAIIETAAGEHDDLLGKSGILPSDIKKLHTDSPTIRAFIRPLNDLQARQENMGENLFQSSLSAPDVAFGFADLMHIDPTLTQDQVAAMLGRSQNYCSELFRTYEGLKGVMVPAGATTLNKTAGVAFGNKDVPLLELWRAEADKPPKQKLLAIAEMTVGKGDAKVAASPQEKLDAYMKLTRPAATPTPLATGPGAWAKNAVNETAPKVGKLLGHLVRDGAITVRGPFGPEHVPALLALAGKTVQEYTLKLNEKGKKVKVPDPKLPEHLENIAHAFTKAVREGAAEPVAVPTPPADTETEETEGAANGSTPKKASGRGRAATAAAE